MRKKLLWVCVCLPLAVIAAGVGIYLASEHARRPENVFPAWWKIVDEPVHGVTPGTTLTLTGIDFDQPGFGVNDVRRDIILSGRQR